MTKDEPYPPLRDALMKRDRRRLNALCKRLGIKSAKSDTEKWAFVGRRLAREQPEFTERKRGAPKKRERDKIDIKRVKLIDGMQSIIEDDFGKHPSDAKLIDVLRAKNIDPELFPKAVTSKSLARSVSRGRKMLKQQSTTDTDTRVSASQIAKPKKNTKV